MSHPTSFPGVPQPRTQDSGATTSLVLGIVGLVLCGFFAGIPAIVTGRRSMRRIDASGGALDGRGLAVAGVVMGWISTALAGLALVIVIVVFAIGGAVHHAFDDTCSTVGSASC